MKKKGNNQFTGAKKNIYLCTLQNLYTDTIFEIPISVFGNGILRELKRIYHNTAVIMIKQNEKIIFIQENNLTTKTKNKIYDEKQIN